MYREGSENLKAMHAPVCLLITLWLGLLASVSSATPFTSYDLRVNGAVITVIPAELRSPRHQDLIAHLENRHLPPGGTLGFGVLAAGRGAL